MPATSPLEVPSPLSRLFGSSDRLRILAVLANANQPLTAYRIAQVAGIQPPNVYREIKRLSGLSELRKNALPTEGWELVDSQLRRFVQQKVRVYWSEDFALGAASRAARARQLRKAMSNVPLESRFVQQGRRPTASQIRNRRQKDAVLKRGGGRPSTRAV